MDVKYIARYPEDVYKFTELFRETMEAMPLNRIRRLLIYSYNPKRQFISYQKFIGIFVLVQ